MIAFGCSIISPDVYERSAKPGIDRAREADSKVFACQAAGSLFRTYNLLRSQAAACDELEALVLVHEDAEILDPYFCQKLRRTLRDPQVGVVGCVGAVDVSSIAWWDGSRPVGSLIRHYQEMGGGELVAFGAADSDTSPDPRPVEVDSVDGFVMVLSPWAVRNISFDESLGPHWGYDLDFCRQVRAADHKVMVANVNVAHHHPLALVGKSEPWIAAHMRVAEKWEDRMNGVGDHGVDWKARARRAEAEGVVARLQGASLLLQADARSAAHARRLEQVTATGSWRATAPLRKLNALRRSRRQHLG